MNWYRELKLAAKYGKITPKEFYLEFLAPLFRRNRNKTPSYRYFYELLESDKSILAQFIELLHSGPSAKRVNVNKARKLAIRIEKKILFHMSSNPPEGSIQDYGMNKIISENISPILNGVEPKIFRKVMRSDPVLTRLYSDLAVKYTRHNIIDPKILSKIKTHWMSLPSEVTSLRPVYDMSRDMIFEKYIKPHGEPFNRMSFGFFSKLITHGPQPLIDAYKNFAASIRQFEDSRGNITSIRSNGRYLHKLLSLIRSSFESINSGKIQPLVSPEQGTGRGGGWGKFSGSEVIICDVLTMTIGKQNYVFQVDHKLWGGSEFYETDPVVDFLINGIYHFELFGGPGMNSGKKVSPDSETTLQDVYNWRKKEKQANMRNLFWLDNKADNMLKTYSLIKYAEALENHVDTNSYELGKNGSKKKKQLFSGLYDRLVSFKPLLSHFGLSLTEHYVVAVKNKSQAFRQTFEQKVDYERKQKDEQGLQPVELAKKPLGQYPLYKGQPLAEVPDQPLLKKLPDDIRNEKIPSKTSQYNINDYINNNNAIQPPSMEEIVSKLHEEYPSAHLWPEKEQVAVYFGTKENMQPYLDVLNWQNANNQNNMKISPVKPNQNFQMGLTANSNWEWKLSK